MSGAIIPLPFAIPTTTAPESPMSAEATVVRNYVDWLLKVPWKKRTKVHQDLAEARILREEHFVELRRNRKATDGEPVTEEELLPTQVEERRTAEGPAPWTRKLRGRGQGRCPESSMGPRA